MEQSAVYKRPAHLMVRYTLRDRSLTMAMMSVYVMISRSNVTQLHADITGRNITTEMFLNQKIRSADARVEESYANQINAATMVSITQMGRSLQIMERNVSALGYRFIAMKNLVK